MEDGLASIDLAGAGVIRAVTPHGGPSADDVQITVRPEKITMTTGREPAPSGDGWNTVPGVIHESVYLGTHTQFVVRLESGSTVIVHRQNLAQRSEDLRSGAPVVLAFDPQSASVLGE
jgi:ABC-type Fe3+/spermidine/putrescine transport system ATPase subunit